jgi:Arc/MetJ-type ribon-helix-helix transcriptional regulator
MPIESRIQITVKLPINLHATLNKAIEEGKYSNMTAAIITALEEKLSESAEMSKDIQNKDIEVQRLSQELQKNVLDFRVLQTTFDGIQQFTEEKDKQIEEKTQHIDTLKAELEKAERDKEDLKTTYNKLQDTYNNYMAQMQTLIKQKAIEAPGAKKSWWRFW